MKMKCAILVSLLLILANTLECTAMWDLKALLLSKKQQNYTSELDSLPSDVIGRILDNPTMDLTDIIHFMQARKSIRKSAIETSNHYYYSKLLHLNCSNFFPTGQITAPFESEFSNSRNLYITINSRSSEPKHAIDISIEHHKQCLIAFTKFLSFTHHKFGLYLRIYSRRHLSSNALSYIEISQIVVELLKTDKIAKLVIEIGSVVAGAIDEEVVPIVAHFLAESSNVPRISLVIDPCLSHVAIRQLETQVALSLRNLSKKVVSLTVEPVIKTPAVRNVLCYGITEQHFKLAYSAANEMSSQLAMIPTVSTIFFGIKHPDAYSTNTPLLLCNAHVANIGMLYLPLNGALIESLEICLPTEVSRSSLRRLTLSFGYREAALPVVNVFSMFGSILTHIQRLRNLKSLRFAVAFDFSIESLIELNLIVVVRLRTFRQLESLSIEFPAQNLAMKLAVARFHHSQRPQHHMRNRYLTATSRGWMNALAFLSSFDELTAAESRLGYFQAKNIELLPKQSHLKSLTWRGLYLDLQAVNALSRLIQPKGRSVLKELSLEVFSSLDGKALENVFNRLFALVISAQCKLVRFNILVHNYVPKGYNTISKVPLNSTNVFKTVAHLAATLSKTTDDSYTIRHINGISIDSLDETVISHHWKF